MKKLALISSYCETKEKLEVLQNNCRVLKSLGVDTFVSSPIKIEVESDFLYITKENPILTWPDKAISLFRIIPYEGKNLKLQPLIEDPGWASLYQFKKMMEFGSTFQYDIFYLLIYDLMIDEQIINDINNNIKNVTYPRRDFTNPDCIFPSSFHLSIFDKENLKLISSLIRLETYKSQNGFAEDFIERWMNVTGINKSLHVVRDLINIAPKNVFNLSKDQEYKFFVSKEQNLNLRFYFYDFSEPVKLRINQMNYDINNGPKFIEIPLKSENLIQFSIESKNGVIDYTDVYKEIIRNILEFVD